MEQCDVLIIGGGMVGLTLASALLQAHLTVTVVESTPATPVTLNTQSNALETIDIRTFALTRASEKIFKQLGVWEIMCQLRVSPFHKMYVWDATGAGAICFDSHEIHQTVLGHIVEQKVILAALLANLVKNPSFALISDQKLIDFSYHKENIIATLSNGQQIHSRLLVGADGANSPTRQLAGIAYTAKDYAQCGLVANVQTEHSHQDTAWQRFLGNGDVLAFLPLLDKNQASIVWSCHSPTARHLLTLSEIEFCEQLANHFEHKLGKIAAVGQRAIFPLIRRHAAVYTQPRLALIGDAAHTVHPLAGQGVNLGLLDAACLAEIVINAAQQGRDIGTLSVLRHYERWRKGDNHAMQKLMETFKGLFGSPLEPVRWLRNTGLNLTNHFSPIKHHIMRHTMGLESMTPLPKLAQDL